jgi:hypothetical protein
MLAELDTRYRERELTASEDDGANASAASNLHATQSLRQRRVRA